MVAGPERLFIPNNSNKRSIGFTSTFTCFTSGNLWKGCHSSRIMDLALGLMISSIAPIRLWSFECCLLMNCSNFFIIGLFMNWSKLLHIRYARPLGSGLSIIWRSQIKLGIWAWGIPCPGPGRRYAVQIGIQFRVTYWFPPSLPCGVFLLRFFS